MKKLITIICCIFLAACAVGPNFHKPVVEIPAEFKEARENWKIAAPNDDFDRGEWWLMFNDETLNHLEAELNQFNQSIAVAYYNYQQAKALADQARANYFPTLNLNLSVTREKLSNSASNPTLANTSKHRILNVHDMLTTAAWVPDIWGKVRRTVEVSENQALASESLLANVRLTSQASLAQIYFELRAVDHDQQILDNLVKNNSKLIEITKNQYAQGVASRADILQAESQLESSQAAAINNKINRSNFEHAIAVLIGKAPAEFSLSFKPLNHAAPLIPVTVPSTLLERRPDIAEAERTMAAANAQIGVAISAYFPTITLSADATSSHNNGLAGLFSIPQMGWAIGAQMTELIFDGGARSSAIAAARASYESSVANYRQVILTAFQEVEDNLATLKYLDEQSIYLNQAEISSKKALELVTNQYKQGTVPFSSVLVAENNAFTAEKNAADVKGLQMTSSVGLLLSLGGTFTSER